MQTSTYPVPWVCGEDHIADWFQSLARCLHWNVRERQRSFSGSTHGSSEESLHNHGHKRSTAVDNSSEVDQWQRDAAACVIFCLQCSFLTAFIILSLWGWHSWKLHISDYTYISYYARVLCCGNVAVICAHQSVAMGTIFYYVSHVMVLLLLLCKIDSKHGVNIHLS